MIESVGFDPADFALATTGSRHRSDTVSLVKHTPTDSYFIFDFASGGARLGYWSPAEDKARAGGNFGDSWPHQLDAVGAWLTVLKRELDEPDLWFQPRSRQEVIRAAVDETDNEPFSADEQAAIAEQLGQLETTLIARLPDSEQQEFVKSALRELIDDSKTSRRRQWAFNAIGVFFTLATFLDPTLGPELMQRMVETFAQVQQLAG
jgi:hypothetical protein